MASERPADTAIPLDDAGRKALRVGDVVRMMFRGNVTQHVVTTAPWCAADWWCVGLSALTYPLDRVTHIVSTPASRGPADVVSIEEERATLRAMERNGERIDHLKTENAALKRDLQRVIDATGEVKHTTPAECAGCGCMSLSAAEAVANVVCERDQLRESVRLLQADVLRHCEGVAEKVFAGQAELRKGLAKLLAAAGPFTKISIPDNWPPGNVLTWDETSRGDAEIKYLFGNVQGGPVIGDYWALRAAADEAAALAEVAK